MRKCEFITRSCWIEYELNRLTFTFRSDFAPVLRRCVLITVFVHLQGDLAAGEAAAASSSLSRSVSFARGNKGRSLLGQLQYIYPWIWGTPALTRGWRCSLGPCRGKAPPESVRPSCGSSCFCSGAHLASAGPGTTGTPQAAPGRQRQHRKAMRTRMNSGLLHLSINCRHMPIFRLYSYVSCLVSNTA